MTSARSQTAWRFAAVSLLLILGWQTADVLRDERLRGLAVNTLQMVCGSVVLAATIGTLLAILFARTNLPFKKALTVPLGVLLIVPLYLQAASWEAGFGRLGWYTMSPDHPQDPWLTGLAAVVWIHGIAGIPWVTFIVAAALWYSDSQLEDEALLNASSLHVLGRVTLRRVGMAVIVASLWVGVQSSGEIAVTDLYRFRSFSEEFYTQLALSPSASFEGAWRLVIPPLLFVVVASVLMMQLAGRLVPPMLSDLLKPPRVFDLRHWRWPAFAFVVGVLGVMVAVPLGSLVYKCGQIVQEIGGQRVRGWTVVACIGNLAEAPGRYAQEFKVTLLLATVSSSCALVLALPIAWWARSPGIGRWLVGLALALGLAIPAPLLGLSVLQVFRNYLGEVGRQLESSTIISPVVALTLRVLPLVVLCCWVVLRTIPGEQLDAAATEGASGFRRLMRIAVPQRTVMWLTIWLLGTVWASGELSASIVVMPPQLKSSVPILVFGYIHMGVRNEEAAICLVMIGLLAILAGVVYWAVRRQNLSPAA